MSSNATLLLARRSIRARLGRLIAISIAIILGVSFVVGSFVLADSLRSGFDTLFTEITENVDLEARTALAFGETSDTATRDPVPAELADEIGQVPGVEYVEGTLQRSAQLVDAEGDAVTTGTIWPKKCTLPQPMQRHDALRAKKAGAWAGFMIRPVSPITVSAKPLSSSPS